MPRDRKGGPVVPQPAGTEELARRLYEMGRDNQKLTLFVGSGLSAAVVPDVTGMLSIADDYAEKQPEAGGLLAALRRARTEAAGDSIEIYRAYRRAFAAWIAGNEFDLVAQAAVLRAYRPADLPPSGRGQWQRVEAALGEDLENDTRGWTLPDGVAALGSVLVARADLFRNRVLTTTFDPLIKVAIARAGGAALSVPVEPESRSWPSPGDGPITVYHLHGYWRADRETARHRLLHNPDYLIENRDRLAARLAELIDTDTVCVLGHSGWDGILAAAVRLIASRGKRLNVWWAGQTVDHDTLDAALRTETGPQPGTAYFHQVDGNLLLPRLAEKLQVPVTPPEPVVRATRHPQWERELVSEQDTSPPAAPLALLRQLDRRFQWERSWSGEPVTPHLVFWPVRLRSSPSVINMVQALAAAALSARDVRVIVCLDDYNVEDAAKSTARFTSDVRRWFDLVPGSRWPNVESLQTFIDRGEMTGDAQWPRHLLRPTRPWDVAREALGERNPSVLSLLMAAKIIPDLGPDDLLTQADKILWALSSRSASHLMTPFTLWAQLNDLLVDEPTASVLTLGGREERKLWEMWRHVFDHGVNQLYNPTIRSLTNQSLMLRWSSTKALGAYLEQALQDEDWAEPGHYVRWLAQNAFLLPAYLRDDEPPVFCGVPLDSWQAVREALAAERAAVDLLAGRVSALYLGQEHD